MDLVGAGCCIPSPALPSQGPQNFGSLKGSQLVSRSSWALQYNCADSAHNRKQGSLYHGGRWGPGWLEKVPLIQTLHRVLEKLLWENTGHPGQEKCAAMINGMSADSKAVLQELSF